ncbi:MAG: hypothetical protein RSA02_08435, partial [Bacteroidales bacterium]
LFSTTWISCKKEDKANAYLNGQWESVQIKPTLYYINHKGDSVFIKEKRLIDIRVFDPPCALSNMRDSAVIGYANVAVADRFLAGDPTLAPTYDYYIFLADNGNSVPCFRSGDETFYHGRYIDSLYIQFKKISEDCIEFVQVPQYKNVSLSEECYKQLKIFTGTYRKVK